MVVVYKIMYLNVNVYVHTNDINGHTYSHRYTLFLVNNTFISNAGGNWQKIKQMLSNPLRLNVCYLKIIYILYPKIKGYILENKKKKNKCVRIHEIMR